MEARVEQELPVDLSEKDINALFHREYRHELPGGFGKASEYREAIAGAGDRSGDWADKPHRLVYDLLRVADIYYTEVAALRETIATLRADGTRAAEELSRLRAQMEKSDHLGDDTKWVAELARERERHQDRDICGKCCEWCGLHLKAKPGDLLEPKAEPAPLATGEK